MSLMITGKPWDRPAPTASKLLRSLESGAVCRHFRVLSRALSVTGPRAAGPGITANVDGRSR